MLTVEKQEDGKHQIQSRKREALISLSRYRLDNPTEQFKYHVCKTYCPKINLIQR